MIDASAHLKDLPRFLYQFLLNPVARISHLPRFSFRDLILLQLSVSLLCGTIEGLITESYFSMILYLCLMPLMTLILCSLLTWFFYFLFRFSFKTTIPPRSLFAIVVFSHIPYLLLQIASNWIPPMSLLGFGSFCLLFTKGVADTHGVERNKVLRVTLILFLIYFVVWSFTLWESTRVSRQHL